MLKHKINMKNKFTLVNFKFIKKYNIILNSVNATNREEGNNKITIFKNPHF